MKLNIGCGEFSAPRPWLNVDTIQLNSINPDVIADVFGLPSYIQNLEAVYCGHFLEHIKPEKVTAALTTLKERMRPQAKICVVGPDVHRAYKMMLEGKLDKETYQHTQKSPPDHAPEWDGDFHHWDCHEEAVVEYLRRAGFADITPVPIRSHLLDAFPVTARVAWQCAVLATNPGDNNGNE